MPIGGALDPQVDLDRLDEGAPALPVSQADRFGAVMDAAGGLTNRVVHWANSDPTHYPIKIPGLDIPVITGPSPALTSEQANERYGVDGYLRFNQPTTDFDASWQSAQARDSRFRDEVFSASRPNPLTDLGAGLLGALSDPTGLALMAATDGLGGAAFDAMGLGDAGAGALAIARAGRLANLGFRGARVLGEGAINNVPYVAANGLMTNYAGDEYDLGDGLRDIAAGALFHGGFKALGFAGRTIRGRLGAVDPEAAAGGVAEPEPMAAPEMPQAVQDLPPPARMAAFVKAVDDAIDDRPVDVGQYVDRELSTLEDARAQEGGSPRDTEWMGALGRPSDPSLFGPGDPVSAAAQDVQRQGVGSGDAAPRLAPDEPPPDRAQPESVARQMSADTADRFARSDAGDIETVRAPGKSTSEASAPKPPTSIFEEGAQEGPRAAARTSDGRPGRAAKGAAAKPSRGDVLIAADPELKALHEDTERLAAENGLKVAAEPRGDPNVLAEATRAAAVCLEGEGLG